MPNGILGPKCYGYCDGPHCYKRITIVNYHLESCLIAINRVNSSLLGKLFSDHLTSSLEVWVQGKLTCHQKRNYLLVIIHVFDKNFVDHIQV